MERRLFLGGMTLAALHPAGRHFGDDDSRVFDVRRFGATGDGRTDDTAALRRAMTELGKAGGILSLPPGDYVVTSPLELPATAAWHIRGGGRTVTRLSLAGGSQGELFRCTHDHSRTTFGCSIQDLTVDIGGRPGVAVRLENLTLFGMRGVSIVKAGGTALGLLGLFDSYFEDVFLEGCGSPTEPAFTCDSPDVAGGGSMNNCVFVNLHVEGGADAVHVSIQGNPRNATDTLQFYALKCHGNPKNGMPNHPLLVVGRHAVGCSFIGGIIAWGMGTTQVEVDGQRNKFIGIDHGAGPPGGSPQFAYRFTEHAAANHVLTPNFKNGVGPNVYRSGLVRVERGASNNKLLFPQMSTGPLPIDRVLSDEGRATLFLGDDIDDGGGLYVRHGLGFSVLRANGLSATTTPAWNLRGSATLSGGTDGADVAFHTSEPDANYFVTCAVAATRGSPPAGARRVWVSDKSPRGFRIHCEQAPGGDNSITVDWMLMR